MDAMRLAGEQVKTRKGPLNLAAKGPFAGLYTSAMGWATLARPQFSAGVNVNNVVLRSFAPRYQWPVATQGSGGLHL